MNKPLLCLVTIHGIGFQQPPLYGVPGYPDTPGYADSLHENLSLFLDDAWLCKNLQPARENPGGNSPIYVQSAWPPNSHCREAGLKRLGQWDTEHDCVIAGRAGQLGDSTGNIAHIALVYSQLEVQGPQVGPAVISGAMTAFSLSHYTTTQQLIRTVLLDTEPFWEHLISPSQDAPPPSSTSLHVRQDPGFNQGDKKKATGFLGILRQVEDDVATYVCQDNMRQRVRSFVYEALIRLAAREDVGGIIVNSHSNGTVVAFDALRQLPPFAAKKIKAFITAGSPLRKYVDFFSWDPYISTLPELQYWYNYVDPSDPVADPLQPAVSWRRGTDIRPEALTGLFKGLNLETGGIYQLPIHDVTVDNLSHSVNVGLKAHNYWDNTEEFVKPLADLLKQEAVQNAEGPGK